MNEFGNSLRFHRRQSRDPLSGGLLTQSRLGELLGETLDDAGYSGAAVSDWERGKSKISEDDRRVLVGLVQLLHRCGGLQDADQADALLRAGNYRGLNEPESEQVFGVEAVRMADPAGRALPQAPATLPPAPGRDPRQQILLDKVKGFWVSGYMQQAVEPATLLDLDRRAYPQAVVHPWQNVLGQVALEDRQAIEKGSVLDAFYAADRALLILGPPGIGKTMTLLHLADDLIELAERNSTAAIPVILHLASWAEHRGTLEEWTVEELTTKYQIPQRLGRLWLAEDALILLLDGFDEVNQRHRRNCAQAINRFRETNGLTGLAVCSRLEAYERMGERLRLGGASLLQPLSSEQVIRYLTAAGPSLAPVQQAVHSQDWLGEVARSPLGLNVLVMAYGQSPDPERGAQARMPVQDVAEVRSLKPLFELYIKRMFGRRQVDPHYPPEQTMAWLSWLAWQMSEHSQSVLLVEQLQPSWLPGRRWRWIYMLLTGLAIGVLGGLAMWLFLLLLRQTAPDILAPNSDRVATLIGIAQGRAEFLTLLLANLGLGPVVAFIQAAYYEQHARQRSQKPLDPRWRPYRAAISAVAVFALTFLGVALFGEPTLALVWAVAEAVMFTVVAYYLYGLSYRREIRIVERLTWSWPAAGKGLIIGLILSAVAEALDTLLYGSDGVFRTTLVLTTSGVILGGLRGRRIGDQSRPLEAVYLSVRNAFLAAAITSVTTGAVALLVRDPTYALLLAILAGFVALALFGGGNVIKHTLLRLMLWRLGCTPWRIVDFLNCAADLALLRKVGGGYVFIHRQMQDHLANRRNGLGLSENQHSG